MTRSVHRGALALIASALLALTGCAGSSDDEANGGNGRGGQQQARRGPGGPGGPGRNVAAVPVEVAPVVRRDISSYLETNGTLEAENEVDVVARTSGPIVELLTEEGRQVNRGQVLARLEQDEIRAELEIARVRLEETRLAYERAERLRKDDLIAVQEYDQARAAYESAKAEFDSSKLQLDYTEVRAPFAGMVVRRYVDYAQNVTSGTPLFRLSDFTPLLCPIQVPERELGRLAVGQRAHLRVETFGDRRFEARVLRISPVVDAATGTVKVTLDVAGHGKLRPGMFARVFLETETHPDTLVIPKAALSLESIGDTVYVATDGKASRREVTLGFRQGDHVEVLSGLNEGEQVVVVGQDGLTEGTPLQVMDASGRVRAGAPVQAGRPGAPAETAAPQPATDDAGPEPGRRRPGGRPDLAGMTPEQLERAKELMRARGMTEEQIEERIRRARERADASGSR